MKKNRLPAFTRCSMRGNLPQQGFALLEVLVSILIFSFGVLGLDRLQARAITLSTDAEDRNRAALLASDIASLRKEAAAALGEIADPSVRDALMEHISDADPDVRKTVRWALTRLG